MVRLICEIMVTLDFIFRLVHCSCEDVLIKHYLSELVRRHQAVLLVNVV